jgi:hypothetical protein
MNLVNIVLGDIHIYDENHSYIMMNVDFLLCVVVDDEMPPSIRNQKNPPVEGSGTPKSVDLCPECETLCVAT